MSADHKRPLFAFVLVMLACVLIIANGLRSEAFVGMLRARADRVVAGVQLVPVPLAPVRAPHRQPTEPPVLDGPASTASTAADTGSGGSAPQHSSAQHASTGHPSTGHAAPAPPQAGPQYGGPQQGHVKQVHVQHGQVEHGPVGQAETATHELAHQVSQQVGQLLGQRGHGAQGRGRQAEAHGYQGRGRGHAHGQGHTRGHHAGLLAVHLPGQHLGPRWARHR